METNSLLKASFERSNMHPERGEEGPIDDATEKSDDVSGLDSGSHNMSTHSETTVRYALVISTPVKDTIHCYTNPQCGAANILIF